MKADEWISPAQGASADGTSVRTSAEEVRQRKDERRGADAVRAELGGKLAEVEARVDELQQRPIPLATEADLPLEAFEEHGEPEPYTSLRDWLIDLWRQYELVSKAEPKKYIAGWDAPLGTAMAGAVPMAVRMEFLDRKHPADGTYYLRVRHKAGEESPRDVYRICKVTPPSAGSRDDGKGSNKNVALHTNTVALRTIETLEASGKEQEARLAAERADNDRLRADLNAARDDVAERDRTIKARDAEIADLKAAGEPLFDKEETDVVGEHLVLAVQDHLQKPNAASQAQIDAQEAKAKTLWEGIYAFMQGLHARPGTLRLLLEEAPEDYDLLTAAFNKVNAGDKLLGSGEVLKRLPSPVDEATFGDDALLADLLAARAELLAARARIEELEATKASLDGTVQELRTAVEGLEATLAELVPEEPEPEPVARVRAKPAKAAAPASRRATTRPKRRKGAASRPKAGKKGTAGSGKRR
jgi:hypothetical protein